MVFMTLWKWFGRLYGKDFEDFMELIFEDIMIKIFWDIMEMIFEDIIWK